MPERYLLHLSDSTGTQGTLARVDGMRVIDSRPIDLNAVPTDLARLPLDVLLPASWCSLLNVTIPTRKRAQAQKALLFAVEEQLATDTDTLHLTLGNKPDAQNRWPVLAVDRQQRERLLERLQAAELTPARLICELDALPLNANRWTLLPLAERTLIATGLHAGFAVPDQDLGHWFSALESLPEHGLVLYAPPELRENAAACCDSLSIACEQRNDIPSMMAVFAEGLQSHTVLSAWQAPTNPLIIQSYRYWGIAASVLVAWVLVITSHAWLEGQRAQAENARLQAQIETLFRQALPDVQRMVNPRVQIEQALASTAAKTSRTDLLVLLHALARTTASEDSLSLQRLEFIHDRLEVSVIARQYASIEALMRKLEEQPGIQSSLASSRATEGQAEARIQIRQEKPT